jgi:hypothetical protein
MNGGNERDWGKVPAATAPRPSQTNNPPRPPRGGGGGGGGRGVAPGGGTPLAEAMIMN